jgi:hypothetical protein
MMNFKEWSMASRYGNARKLAWLLACFLSSGMGCDDDSAADSGGHDDDHGDHGAAGSGEHDHTTMVGPLTGATCPSDSTLTYDNFGKKFMEDYCLRCHSSSKMSNARTGAPADHNFDTLDDIKLLAAHIDQMAGSGPSATNTKMPPTDPKPSMEDRQKLSQWLVCGGK